MISKGEEASSAWSTQATEGGRQVRRWFQQHPAGQVQPTMGTQKRGWSREDCWRQCNVERTPLKESKMRDGEPAEKVSKGNRGKR